jgi:hypothetical protein
MIGRAGVIGFDRAAADTDMPVPMAERDIVGGGRRDLVVADEPGRTQLRSPVRRRLVMSVRDRDLPEAAPRMRALQRVHVAVVAMRVAPDLKAESGKQNGRVMRDAEDVNMWERGDAAAVKDGIGDRRIVIARKDHDRHPGFGQEKTRPVEGL